ncbi:hypothetical protein HOY82DRAFT_608269 [Tuber indicum]|nr:hypothetical protein HOY82DRAFT_608269 [Tuber indicum]
MSVKIEISHVGTEAVDAYAPVASDRRKPADICSPARPGQMSPGSRTTADSPARSGLGKAQAGPVMLKPGRTGRLRTLDHPFIMVGKYAPRWMGVPVCTGYTSFFGILNYCPHTKPLFKLAVEYRSVRKLKRYHDEWYIGLRSEVTCCLTVDSQKIQVPHVVNYNSLLVESEFHPNSADRSVRPYLLTDSNIKFVGDPPLAFPVFIPTVPQFLDSCLNCIRGRSCRDDRSCILPQIDLDNIARYLVLDSPSQQHKLLAKVANRERLAEYFQMRERNQQRRMKRIMERRAKYQVDAQLEVPIVIPAK